MIYEMIGEKQTKISERILILRYLSEKLPQGHYTIEK